MAFEHLFSFSIGTKRRILVAVLASVALLPSPAPAGLLGPGKFEIVQTDDRFSTSPTATFMGRNNLISKKSPAGGTYIGNQGLFLEPLVSKNRAGGQVSQIGFFFHNETTLDTAYGSPNSLGAPQRISFIVDGTRNITTQFTQTGTQFGEGVSYNSIGNYASSGLRETGLACVSPADMAVIAHATSIAIKIEGNRRAVIYEEKDIARTFLPNLAAFYAARIAT